jgi:hypothetical protein
LESQESSGGLERIIVPAHQLAQSKKITENHYCREKVKHLVLSKTKIMDCISYTEGNYKYQLTKEYSNNIGINPETDVSVAGFITLTKEGKITIKKDYAWDGPSGPAVDTLNFMRGSLIHDALYQLIRNKKLEPRETYRKRADELLRKNCRQDGMSAKRAKLVYHGVRMFGNPATSPKKTKEERHAPKPC